MFFQIYEGVITQELEKKGRECYDEIRKGVSLIRKKYSKKYLDLEANSIDFSKWAHRCSYVYLYSTSHSSLLKNLLSDAYTLYPERFSVWDNQNFIGRKVNITSLGGGPGSELLGILAFFIQELRFSTMIKFNCTLVDAYQGWENICLSSIHRFCNSFHLSPDRIATTYYSENLLQANLSPTIQSRLKETNIVTMVKFLSAIAPDLEGSSYLIKKIFSLLRAEAWVIYVDNAYHKLFTRMCNFAKSAGLEPVYGPHLSQDFVVDIENCNYFDLMKLFGAPPQTFGSISFAIWKKPLTPQLRGLKREVDWLERDNAHFECKRTVMYNECQNITIKLPNGRNEIWNRQNDSPSPFISNRRPFLASTPSPPLLPSPFISDRRPFLASTPTPALLPSPNGVQGLSPYLCRSPLLSLPAHEFTSPFASNSYCYSPSFMRSSADSYSPSFTRNVAYYSPTFASPGGSFLHQPFWQANNASVSGGTDRYGARRSLSSLYSSYDPICRDNSWTNWYINSYVSQTNVYNFTATVNVTNNPQRPSKPKRRPKRRRGKKRAN